MKARQGDAEWSRSRRSKEAEPLQDRSPERMVIQESTPSRQPLQAAAVMLGKANLLRLRLWRPDPAKNRDARPARKIQKRGLAKGASQD